MQSEARGPAVCHGRVWFRVLLPLTVRPTDQAPTSTQLQRLALNCLAGCQLIDIMHGSY